MHILNEGYVEGTYLYWDEDDYNLGFLCIRFPGATRGCIYFDKSDIITKIDFYEDTCFDKGIGCYEKSLLNIVSQWIGHPLNLNEVRS